MIEASAPGKLILCGEHAVVYGRPAIALPLSDVRARVVLEDGAAGGGITFDAPDLGRRWALADDAADPLGELVVSLLDYLGVAAAPDLLITISSSIPIASGMGSGAAVATALVRGLARHLGHDLPPETVSALVYTSERRFHGTPSGIDNTVIAYERAIWFVRPTTDHRPPTNDQRPTTNDRPPTPDPRPLTPDPRPLTAIQNLVIAAPLTLLVGDTGVRSATRLPVGEVRLRRQAEPDRYEALFDAIGALVARTRDALARGDLPALGALLDENHALLQQIGVSSPQLDRLVSAARAAGALGAKLSGAGWGGVMLALVAPMAAERVAAALAAAGAARVLATTVEQQPDTARP